MSRESTPRGACATQLSSRRSEDAFTLTNQLIERLFGMPESPDALVRALGLSSEDLARARSLLRLSETEEEQFARLERAAMQVERARAETINLPAARARPMTGTEVIAALSEMAEVDRRAVARLLDALRTLIRRQLSSRGPGEFVIPGVLTLRVRRRSPLSPSSALGIAAKAPLRGELTLEAHPNLEPMPARHGRAKGRLPRLPMSKPRLRKIW